MDPGEAIDLLGFIPLSNLDFIKNFFLKVEIGFWSF